MNSPVESCLPPLPVSRRSRPRRGLVPAVSGTGAVRLLADHPRLVPRPAPVKRAVPVGAKRDRPRPFRPTYPQAACQEPVSSLFFVLAPTGQWRLTRCRIARAPLDAAAIDPT